MSGYFVSLSMLSCFPTPFFLSPSFHPISLRCAHMLTRLLAFCPARLCCLHASAIHRCLFPSPHGVYFADVVFADVFTSFAKVLGDMWLSVCMLLPSGSLLGQPAQDGLTRWILPTIMR